MALLAVLFTIAFSFGIIVAFVCGINCGILLVARRYIRLRSSRSDTKGRRSPAEIEEGDAAASPDETREADSPEPEPVHVRRQHQQQRQQPRPKQTQEEPRPSQQRRPVQQQPVQAWPPVPNWSEPAQEMEEQERPPRQQQQQQQAYYPPAGTVAQRPVAKRAQPSMSPGFRMASPQPQAPVPMRARPQPPAFTMQPPGRHRSQSFLETPTVPVLSMPLAPPPQPQPEPPAPPIITAIDQDDEDAHDFV